MQQHRGGRNQDADQTLWAGIRIREKNFELMDSLYKAAVEGHIDQFRAHATTLDQILTPKENTILHIRIPDLQQSLTASGRSVLTGNLQRTKEIL